MTALELAGSIRSGARSARAVVDEHLAVVAAREDELHACNLVTDDAAGTLWRVTNTEGWR